MNNYRPELDIASLVLLIVIFAYFLMKKRASNLQNKVFTVFVFFAFINIVMCLITIYAVNNYKTTPLKVNYLVNTLYLAMQFILPFFAAAYVSTIFLKHSYKQYRKILMYAIPAVICALVLLIFNYSEKWFFYYDKVGIYQHGSAHTLLFYNAAIYYISAVIIVLFGKADEPFSRRIAMILIFSVAVSGAILQKLFPREMFGGFGITISLLLLSLTFQDPKDDLDLLSGMFNKTAFSNSVNSLYEKNREFYILALAVNGFSRINDAYGVETGNLVIKSMAQNISRLSTTQNIYRYGGDKFIIIFNDHSYVKVAEDIIEFFNKPLSLDYVDVLVSLRFSLVRSMDIESTNHLIRTIDYSLKEAKKYGRNHILEVDYEILSEIKKHIAIENEIHSSIDNNTFEVHYQPIYDFETKTYTWMEALARLQIEPYGYISPELFISLAEKDEQIIELGMTIIEEVFKFINSSKIESMGVKKIDINLSIVQCMQPSLAREIIALAKWYKIKPSMINFEITETAQIFSRSILVDNMNELIKYGFEFSLDDYGTGYSTLEFIMNLPFSNVKLDKKFVQDSINNRETRTVLEYTALMLNSLNKSIVAEGVETKELDDLMDKNRIRYIQGYYHSKPLKGDDVIKFIKEKNIE